jgi:hypothetical protein
VCSVELVQRLKNSRGRDLVYRAVAGAVAEGTRCPVKLSVRALTGGAMGSAPSLLCVKA